MAEDKQYFVQTIGIKMNLPNGTQTIGKFMGLAICEPKQWQEILDSEKPLGELLAEKDGVMFTNPIPLKEAIVDGDQYNDIIDIIREEASKDHHDELKEKEN